MCKQTSINHKMSYPFKSLQKKSYLCFRSFQRSVDFLHYVLKILLVRHIRHLIQGTVLCIDKWSNKDGNMRFFLLDTRQYVCQRLDRIGVLDRPIIQY